MPKDNMATTILVIATSHWYSIGGCFCGLLGILSPLIFSYNVARDRRLSTENRIPKITIIIQNLVGILSIYIP